MVLNDDQDQNNENHDESISLNLLPATSNNHNIHHPTKRSVAAKKRNVKGTGSSNSTKKRRRSTASSITLQPSNDDNDEVPVDLSSSSSSSSIFYSRSNDGSASIPSLQAQSMDGSVTLENVATSNSNGDSSQSQQLFPMIENEKEDDVDLNVSADAPNKPSLFGSVMKNVTASSTVGIATLSTSDTTAAATTSSSTGNKSSIDPMTPARSSLQRTPKGSRTRSSHRDDENGNDSANRSLMKRSNKAFTMNSPGGFQLLDFVNGFGNSPLFHKLKPSTAATHHHHHQQQRTPDPSLRKNAFNIRADIHHTPRNHPTTPCHRNNDDDDGMGMLPLDSSKRAPPPIPATPRQEVEWHECVIQQHQQMHWIDWSIQSTIEIQYQPANVLDAFLLSSPTGPNPSSVLQYKQKAIQQFASSSSGGGHDKRRRITSQKRNQDDTAIDFYSALCYWQHPAIYPMPDEFFAKPRSKNQVSQPPSVPKSKSSLPTDMLSSYSQNSNSRLAMPPPKKHMRAFTSTTTTSANNTVPPNTNASLLQTRISEWKDAFQSLYVGWLNKIQCLNQQWDDIASNVNSNTTLDDFYQRVSDTYFYAMGKGHTILFRVGVIQPTTNGSSDTSHSSSKPQLQPEIILSSSSQSLRQKLRSMNVPLYLLNEWNCHTGVFDDEYLYGSSTGVNSKATEAAESASPNVMAELIALRRQQMTRWRVGPDIAILMKPKSRALNQYTPSPKSVPPLRISGTEQCTSFFDVYYHSLGQVGTTNYVENFHVRDLTVDVPLLLCRKLGPFLHASIKSNVLMKKEEHIGSDTPSRNTTLDLRGYILPCAVRDLTCAIADAMQDRKTAVESGIEKDDAEACSCHFVVQSTVHPGYELKNVSGLGAIGSHCSKRLNGSWDFLDIMNETTDMQHCHQDEVLHLAVWDESRPTSLAIKLHHMPTFL